uniref:Uncharacterized protein n=1 Tax=viral metagenome TaxID=1070528 RepID=A0A6C0JEZ7_9ZZZZ
MILESIYLFFRNMIITFSNIRYLHIFFNTLFLLTISTSIPYYLLEYISNISPNDYINLLSVKIYKIFYNSPSFVILFIIHNFKLSKLLSTTFKVYNNPNHLYVSGLSIFIYSFFYIISLINDKFLFFHFLANTLSYSIFLNELAYSFMNNNLYNYHNKIDFYNNNYYIFILYGFLTTYLTYIIPINLFLPCSFIICSLIQNSVINLTYNKCSNNKLNLLYPIEVIFNPIANFLGNIILFWIRRRNMISIKY